MYIFKDESKAYLLTDGYMVMLKHINERRGTIIFTKCDARLWILQFFFVFFGGGWATYLTHTWEDMDQHQCKLEATRQTGRGVGALVLAGDWWYISELSSTEGRHRSLNPVGGYVVLLMCESVYEYLVVVILMNET